MCTDFSVVIQSQGNLRRLQRQRLWCSECDSRRASLHARTKVWRDCAFWLGGLLGRCAGWRNILRHEMGTLLVTLSDTVQRQQLSTLNPYRLYTDSVAGHLRRHRSTLRRTESLRHQRLYHRTWLLPYRILEPGRKAVYRSSLGRV